MLDVTKKTRKDSKLLAPLFEPAENLLTVKYLPADGEESLENPPRFQWIPPQVGNRQYQLEIQRLDGSGKPVGTPQHVGAIKFPFYTASEPMEAGSYSWRYRIQKDDCAVSQWSKPHTFSISNDSVIAPVPANLIKALGPRPRLAISPATSEKLADHLQAASAWQNFYDKSVVPWIERTIPAEPEFYPDHKRTAPLWRRSYITCQEMLYGIRNLSIAGVTLKNTKLLNRAKEWLLSLASWDPEGSTSRNYNDEAAFRVVTALAWGFDWLKDQLTEEEVELVRTVLHSRGQQVAHHVMNTSRIDTFPFDSHAVRAVSAVMIPVGLALAGEHPDGDLWLEYSANYLAGPFSAWGDADGGWAEGVHYWTTAMAYALESATLLHNTTGLNVFQRPFFKNTGSFPLFCRPAWTKRGTFGDDSTMGTAPSPKIARNVRLLASATSNPDIAAYADQIEELSDSDENAYYNYGWWDLSFDDLLQEASFEPVEANSTLEGQQIRVLKGVGWASLQYQMNNPQEHIHCVFKSSPFGSISHSHGDQNSFCLSAFGEDILVQSGHYVAHNSSMHRTWRRQTISKNALLIDGRGQYAEEDKFLCRQSQGKIVDFGAEANHQWVKGIATAAYQSNNSSVKHVERHIHQVFGSSFVIVDHVELHDRLPLTWLAHTYAQITPGELSATLTGERSNTSIEIVYSQAPVQNVKVVEGFDNVAESDYVDLDQSRRLEVQLEPAKVHRLAVVVTPLRPGTSPQTSCFVDDQGFGAMLYCMNDQAQPIRVPIGKPK